MCKARGKGNVQGARAGAQTGKSMEEQFCIIKINVVCKSGIFFLNFARRFEGRCHRMLMLMLMGALSRSCDYEKLAPTVQLITRTG